MGGLLEKLTTQQLAEVLAALRAQQAEGGRELRVAPRVSVNARVTVWWIGDDGKPEAAASGYAQDISIGGVSLVVARAARSGEPFIVGLPRPRREPLLVRCEATHARELADGVYRVGAKFRATIERNQPATQPASADAGE